MSHVLSQDGDILCVVHSNEALIALSGEVGILCLEVDQSHLVAVLHQHKPVPEHTLRGGEGEMVGNSIAMSNVCYEEAILALICWPLLQQ